MSSFLKRGKKNSKTTDTSQVSERRGSSVKSPSKGQIDSATNEINSAKISAKMAPDADKSNSTLIPSTGPWQFAVASERNVMMSCGYWDGEVKVHSFDGSGVCKQLCSSRGGHRGFVNCLALGNDGYTLITGGSDATVRVWCIDNEHANTAMSAMGSAAGTSSIDSFGIGEYQTSRTARNNLSTSTEFSISSGVIDGRDGRNGDESINAIGTSTPGSATSEFYLKHSFRSGAKRPSVPVYDDTGGMDCGDGLLRRSHVLCGHDSPITCVAISIFLDVAISCSTDGTVMVHTVRQGRFIRSLKPFDDLDQAERCSNNLWNSSAPPSKDIFRRSAVNMVVIDDVFASMVLHSWSSSHALAVFSMNGERKSSFIRAEQEINSGIISRSGRTLITGGSKGILTFRSLPDLRVVRTIMLKSHGPVKSISFTPDGGHEIIVSSLNGKIHVVTDPSYLAVERMPDLLAETFVG